MNFTKHYPLLGQTEVLLQLLIHFAHLINISSSLGYQYRGSNRPQQVHVFSSTFFHFQYTCSIQQNNITYYQISSYAILPFIKKLNQSSRQYNITFQLIHMSFLIKYLFWDQQYIPYTQPPKPQPQPQPLTQQQKAIAVLKSLEEKIAAFESKEMAMRVKMQQLKQSGIDYLALGKKAEAKHALEHALTARNMAEGYKERADILRQTWAKLKQSIEDQQLVGLMQNTDGLINAPQAQ